MELKKYFVFEISFLNGINGKVQNHMHNMIWRYGKSQQYGPIIFLDSLVSASDAGIPLQKFEFPIFLRPTLHIITLGHCSDATKAGLFSQVSFWLIVEVVLKLRSRQLSLILLFFLFIFGWKIFWMTGAFFWTFLFSFILKNLNVILVLDQTTVTRIIDLMLVSKAIFGLFFPSSLDFYNATGLIS